MPLLEMRDLLARTGHGDITRLDDHQVRKTARLLMRSGALLRSLTDVRAVLEFSLRSGAFDRIGLRQLFDRAIDLLDFRVDKSRGLLYASQYSTYQNSWLGPGAGLTGEILSAEQLPSGAADKATIAHTTGGRWLLSWNLQYLLGASDENAVWAHATRRYIDELSGDVEVLLHAREFQDGMLRPAWHPLYEVPGVRNVTYFLDDDPGRIANPPKELFGAGVVRKAFEKLLTFRAEK